MGRRYRLLETARMASTSAEPSSRPSWWWLAGTLGSGTAIALALALAVVTLDEGGESRPRAGAGSIFDNPYAEDPLPRRANVVLPWQHLDVAVGTPQGELPAALGERADVAPPEGGSFVRVDIEPTRQGEVPFIATARPLQTQVEVVLRADGAEYPLDPPGGIEIDVNAPMSYSAADRWVAVPGRPSDIEVAVIVDGEEQTVHSDGTVTSGRAADLPAPRATEEEPVACGKATRGGSTRVSVPDYIDELSCEITTVVRTPYVDGVGWAPPGREYLAILYTNDRLSSVVADDGEEWTATTSTVARMGEDEPIAGPLDVNALNSGTLAIQDPDRPDMVVFEVGASGSPGDLTLRQDIAASPTDPFDASRERMHLTWTVPGEDLR